MVAVSHFSDIGFALDTTDASSFGASLNGLMRNCQELPLDDTDTICLIKDKSGAELHIGLKRSAGGGWDLQTTNPAFTGNGRADVEIAADVSDPEYKTFERNFFAHFNGDQTPIVFELANPTDAASLVPGVKVTISITAFGYDPHLFADEATYIASQGNGKVKFAVNYFVPSGMFSQNVGGSMKDNSKLPSPEADFAGTILKAELHANTLGEKYWWASVKTYDGAVFDVVMDPTSLKENPKSGSILSGHFWLSAHLAPSP